MRRNLQTLKLLPNIKNNLILFNNNNILINSTKTSTTKLLINSNNLNRSYSILSNKNHSLNYNKMTGIKEVLAKIVPSTHSRSNSTDVSNSNTPIISTPT